MLNPGGIGQAITSPVVPQNPILAPEQKARVPAWKNFMDRLNTDPNLRMALLQTGLGLLKDNQPGQSGFDVFADAARTGVSTFDTLQQRDNAEAIQEQERGNEADQRSRVNERADRQIDLQEKSLSARQDQIAQNQSNADRNYQLALQKLQQSKAQNIAGNLTGTERILSSTVEALKTVYPDKYSGEQGSAQARLDAQTFAENAQNPERRASGVLQAMKILQEADQAASLTQDNHVPLGTGELMERAQSFYSTIVGGFDEQARLGGGKDDLDGTTVNYQGRDALVRKVDGGYRIILDGRMSDQTVSKEVIMRLQEQGN